MKGRHPVHPKCPGCGRSMYKASEKGAKVKKTDPWRYCRNKACDLFGVDQSVKKGKRTSKASSPAVKKRKPGPEPASESVAREMPEKQPPKVEHFAVVQARERIRRALESDDGQERSIIGLTLAMLAQEIGHREFADVLIDEYDLAERFGILKSE